MAYQRFKREYLDSDYWNFNTWYLLTASKLLRQWTNKGVSYPALLVGKWQKDEKKRHDTLIYMAELLKKAVYEEYDGWLSDMTPEEHFDLIKKYFFDMWD